MVSSQRCAVVARGAGHDAIGSALVHTSFVVVELALPWPPDVEVDRRLTEVVAAAQAVGKRSGARWRVLAVVPEDPGAPSRRIVAHVLPDGAFDHYRRWELEVPADDLDASAAAIVRDIVASGARPMPPVDELLLCTHGRRDICCGSGGTVLWRELTEGALVPGLAVHRSSHLGGHRFAPTGLHLPSGTMWAWLDPVVVERLVERRTPFATVSRHYRGACWLPSAAEQVVERAVLERVGWAWLEAGRTSTSTPTDGGYAVRLTGGGQAWSGEVREVGRSEVPACGAEGSTKTAPVFGMAPEGIRQIDTPTP